MYKYGRQGSYNSSQGMKSFGWNQEFTKSGRSGIASPGPFFEKGFTKPQELKFVTRNWQLLKLFSVPKAWENPWPIILTYFHKFLRPVVGIFPGLRIYTPISAGPLCAPYRKGGISVTKQAINTTASAAISAVNILTTITKDDSLLDDTKEEEKTIM